MSDPVYTLDEKNRLTGDFTDVLDLRVHQPRCKYDSYFYEEPIDYSVPAPLKVPQMLIENIPSVRALYLPANEINYSYVAICHLCELEELYIIGRDCVDYYLHWLDLIDLPSLKQVYLEGDMEWLRIINAPALSTLDLRKLKYIDMVHVAGMPALTNVDVDGCLKLMSIGGMSEESKSQLGIKAQIKKNQSVSRLDGTLYENMTATDINHAFSCLEAEAINAHKEGRLSNIDEIKYGYRLLNPLEWVNSHGTGEVYAYAYEDYYSYEGHSGASGERTPEDCLERAKEDLEDILEDQG